MSFPCTECEYSTSHPDDLRKHVTKRHNNTSTVHNLPPKIAHHNPNIIEPDKNDQFLRDIEQQELTDMLSTQAGLGLSQMPSTPPPSPPQPPSLPPGNNNKPR